MRQHTWREWSAFVLGFFRAPATNGSLIPSSWALTEAMVAGLPWNHIDTLVELGSGVGTFTGAIMERVRPDTRVILVEIDATYAEHLRTRYGSRVIVEEASAADLDTILRRHGITELDCIISGLPLVSLPTETSRAIADCLKNHIKQGTIYRSFTYRPSRTIRFFGV